MNAHILRKWSSIKFFMHLLLVIFPLFFCWCRGTSAATMQITPFDISSSSISLPATLQQHEQQQQPKSSYFNSLIRNVSNYQNIIDDRQKYVSLMKDELRQRRLWQTRMKNNKRRNNQVHHHHTGKSLLHRLYNHQRSSKLIYLKNKVIQNNLIFPRHHSNNNNNKNNNNINDNNIDHTKLNNTTISSLSSEKKIFSRSKNYKMNSLNKIFGEVRTNYSFSSNNRNRRESRFHHSQQQPTQNINHHYDNLHNHHQLLHQQHHTPSLHVHKTNNNNNNLNNINNNNNSNNNNNNNNNSNRGNRRNGRKRYCSARDPRTLAFEAPTVFEGKIKSMTPDRQRNFSATVEIIHVYKQQFNYKLPKQLRLQFTYRNSSECDIYREEFRHRGFVRDELEQGKIYYFFVKQISLGNFTILGQPIRKISRTAKDVEIGVSEKYGKVASIESISKNLTEKEGKRVRIVCKVNGEPSPKVTWFKDGRSINRNRTKFEFVHSRRRSDLIIKSTVATDSGKYECRAKNKLIKKPVSKFTILTVKHTPTTTDRSIKLINEGVQECPPRFEGFCFNGGTCLIIETLGEYSCNCLEGFSGKRCEDKTTDITPNFQLADPFLKKLPVSSTEYNDIDDDDDDR